MKKSIFKGSVITILSLSLSFVVVLIISSLCVSCKKQNAVYIPIVTTTAATDMSVGVAAEMK